MIEETFVKGTGDGSLFLFTLLTPYKTLFIRVFEINRDTSHLLIFFF